MQLLKNLDKASNEAISNGEDYIDLSVRYYKLKVFQQLSANFALLCKLAILGCIVLIGVVFLSVAGAIALGNWVEDPALGYVFMGLGLIVFAVLLYYMIRRYLDRLVLQKMSKSFFDD